MRKPTMCGRNQINMPDNSCDDCGGFEQRLDTLEDCCSDMQSWQEGINTWKNGIDSWKTQINSLVGDIESTLSGIQQQITALTNWQTTINSWKNGIDTWKEGLTSTLTSITNRMTSIETWQSNIDANGYNALTNKPTINGVTVSGNKTSEDYLITAINDIDIATLTPLECYLPPCADSRVDYGEVDCMIVGSEESE